MTEWTKIKERKWELKHNDVVLATIFQKPNHPKVKHGDQFSLYVASPKIYQTYSEVSRTYLFDTFDEAVEAFDRLTEEQALPWAEALLDYFVQKLEDEVVVDDPNLV